MKSIKLIFASLALFCLFGTVQATPITLDYSVSTAAPGLYNYNFSLTLDNHDNTWSAGQGWGWFIFGDIANNQASPLTNFTMTSSFPVGPWTSLTSSGGGHNGPTFNSVISPWTPSFIGQTLTWTGTSTADLAQGALLFSTLYPTSGAVRANFEVANRVTGANVPAPATLALLGLGFVGLVQTRRRKQI